MHYREAGFITLREAITRVAVRRAPDARVREYLKTPNPGAPTNLVNLAPWRWERAPESDPFLAESRPPWIPAAAALGDARKELQHAFAAGHMVVHTRDAAGRLQTVPRNEWHTRVGADLIHAGTAGGLPMRDEPAFMAEAPFAAWLQHRPLSNLPPPDAVLLPPIVTLLQACAWIMLRCPEAARDATAGRAGDIERLWAEQPTGPDFMGAQADLLLALRDGILPATVGSGTAAVPMPARRWRSMMLKCQGGDVVAYEALPSDLAASLPLTVLAVPTASVLALWQPLPGLPYTLPHPEPVTHPALPAGMLLPVADSAASGIPRQAWPVSERLLTGQVSERWGKRGAPGVWGFHNAAVIYAQNELGRLVEINSRGLPPDQKIMVQPGDIYPPDVAEVWWEANDLHTPILLQRLLRGELRAFGDPGRAGAWPEWIAPRAWQDLKRDPGNKQRFEGGGNVYWHVKVLRAEMVTNEGVSSTATAVSPDAPTKRPTENIPSGNLPSGDRWSAFDAFSWITFSEVRAPGADCFEFPKKEWSRDWKHWPPEWLASAFEEIETGIPWTPDPDEVGPFGPDNQRAWAKRIMADTGESAGQLLECLVSDIARYYAIQDRWRKAKAAVNEAMRRGQLPVWGVKAYAPSKPDPNGVHELINPLLFTETRGVNEAGWIDWTPDDLRFVDYRGPSYDQVFFDSAKVQKLWPASRNDAAIDNVSRPEANSSFSVTQAELTPLPPLEPNRKRRVQGFNYERDDAPLVERALEGIRAGTYRHATDAARALAKDATGMGGDESKMKRLLGRIKPLIQPCSAAERD